MEIYKELELQYEELSDEEKQALFIYKSRLGLCINLLHKDDHMMNAIYNSYKTILENPINLFMKITIFKDIDFTSFHSFKNSLMYIKQQVEKATSRLELPEDVTVYRMVSIKNGNELSSISKDNIISTSLDMSQSMHFLIQNEKYEHYLYEIHLEKGTKVGICPYSILYDMNTQRLSLSKTQEQSEIIILKNNIEIEKEDSMKIILGDFDITNIVADTKRKENTLNFKK